MILKSYSKINLTLSVNDKLKNNLHNIQSYFCLINLCDEIKIKKIFKKANKKDEIKFFGRFSKNIDNLNNTVSSTLKLLRKKKLISNYYSIKVKKKIPIFSGLGGGTGNAVSLANFLTNISSSSLSSSIKTLHSPLLIMSPSNFISWKIRH